MKKKLSLMAMLAKAALVAVLALGLALTGCDSGDDPDGGGSGGTNPGVPVPATAIAAGRSRTIVLGNDGKVRATGWNGMGQLGLGDTTDRNAFTEVTGLNGKGITAIAAGDYHTIALGSDGTVWATGRNDIGMLGLGDTTGRNTFTEVTGLNGKGITAIAAGGAGGYNTIALDSGGKVWATGYNYYGYLGLGDTTQRNTFTEVTGLNGKGITAIAAGQVHTIALGSGGKVWATGRSQYGELGLGDNTDRNTFTEVTGLNGKGITAIDAGTWHTIALGSDGTVWATGYNTDGQLGLGDITQRNTFTEVTLY